MIWAICRSGKVGHHPQGPANYRQAEKLQRGWPILLGSAALPSRSSKWVPWNDGAPRRSAGSSTRFSMPPSSSVPSSSTTHPFQNTTGLLVLIPDKIDIEEESRFYDDLCDVRPLAFFFGVGNGARRHGTLDLGPRRRVDPSLTAPALGVLARYLARG